jgi:DNA-directed RNA polymerase
MGRLMLMLSLFQFVERYKDHVIPVKVARDIYLSNKRKADRQASKPELGISVDADAEEENLDEAVVEAEDTSEGRAVKRRNSRATPFVNADGEDRDKIDIGTRQFVRFNDALPSTPLKGDFDVNNIRESPYFFS